MDFDIQSMAGTTTIRAIIYIDNHKYSGIDIEETTSCGGEVKTFSNKLNFQSCSGSSNQ